MTNGTEKPQLSTDALTLVFKRMELRDVCRANVVCKSWKRVASNELVLGSIFARQWKLASVSGSPRFPNLWQALKLANFARKHWLQPDENLAGLAIRFGVSVMLIKQTNNITSEHALTSRDCIFIPVTSASMLEHAAARFEFCPVACRDFVVVSRVQQDGEGEDELVLPKYTSSGLRDKARIRHILCHTLEVDEGTAQYYLEEADYDVKAAIMYYEEDVDYAKRHNLQCGADRPNHGMWGIWFDLCIRDCWNTIFPTFGTQNTSVRLSDQPMIPVKIHRTGYAVWSKGS